MDQRDQAQGMRQGAERDHPRPLSLSIMTTGASVRVTALKGFGQSAQHYGCPCDGHRTPLTPKKSAGDGTSAGQEKFLSGRFYVKRLNFD